MPKQGGLLLLRHAGKHMTVVVHLMQKQGSLSLLHCSNQQSSKKGHAWHRTDQQASRTMHVMPGDTKQVL